MVKVGFIVEGDSEKIILLSEQFDKWLVSIGIEKVRPVINAKGNGNLIPKNIEVQRNKLIDNGADHIIVLTDLDEDACFSLTKERIGKRENEFVIISRKMLEAWFLADSTSISKFLGVNYYEELPERIDNPFEHIRNTNLRIKERGIGGKTILADRMIKSGFSVSKAAKHPNCPSALYFVEKLKSLTK